MIRSSWCIVIAGLLLLTTACGDSAPGQSGPQRIEGTVLYRERMMLPPGAEMSVQLEDISRPDAMAEVLAVVSSALDGAPPYAFTLDYGKVGVVSGRRYALRANIAVDGQVWFTSTDYIDPFGESPLEILVRRVPGQSP